MLHGARRTTKPFQGELIVRLHGLRRARSVGVCCGSGSRAKEQVAVTAVLHGFEWGSSDEEDANVNE